MWKLADVLASAPTLSPGGDTAATVHAAAGDGPGTEVVEVAPVEADLVRPCCWTDTVGLTQIHVWCTGPELICPITSTCPDCHVPGG